MIQVTVRGMQEVEAFLKSVPLGATKSAQTAISEYIVGNDQHGLKHYPPYRKVTREEAYGVTFFSDRQRRWFFWALKNDKIDIPYQQTWKMKDAWKVTFPFKNQAWITNNVPYALHVMDDVRQSRMAAKKGWRKVSAVISSNMIGAMRSGNLAVQKWIKQHNK